MATSSKNCLWRNRKPVGRRLRRERAVRSLDSIFFIAWVSLFLPVPSLGDCYLVVKVAHERSGTLHPAFAARRGLSCNPLSGVYNSCPDSLAVLAGVQRHPRQRALGEALGHQAGWLDQPSGSLRRWMEEQA